MWEYLNDLDMEISKADELVSIAYTIAAAEEADGGIMKGTLYGLARIFSETVEKMQELSDAVWDKYREEDREKKAKGGAA